MPSFLALPLEVRDNVYEYLFNIAEINLGHIAHLKPTPYGLDSPEFTHNVETNLLAVCRTTRAESLVVLARHLKFHVPGRWFRNSPRPQHVSRLPKIIRECVARVTFQRASYATYLLQYFPNTQHIELFRTVLCTRYHRVAGGENIPDGPCRELRGVTNMKVWARHDATWVASFPDAELTATAWQFETILRTTEGFEVKMDARRWRATSVKKMRFTRIGRRDALSDIKSWEYVEIP